MYSIHRHDNTHDRSLKAWNAADELIYFYAKELNVEEGKLSIYHDRFGYLSCHLNICRPQVITHLKSQQKAIRLNAEANGLDTMEMFSPLEELRTKAELILMKMPKSMKLFRFYLEHIHHNSSDESEVVCAFMTRHFTPKMLSIAGEYFEYVEQSRAEKKARRLHLKEKKSKANGRLIHEVSYRGKVYQQYPGVFSADHIDYASQFLLENIERAHGIGSILDLGSGNGVLAKEVSEGNEALYLIDDAYLAYASGKLNLPEAHHHWDNDLRALGEKEFDLILCNPPFHFEYEVQYECGPGSVKKCQRPSKRKRRDLGGIQ